MRETADAIRDRPSSQASECTVGFGSQAWIEAPLSWFMREFGANAALGQVAVPSAGLNKTLPTCTSTPREECFRPSEPATLTSRSAWHREPIA